MKMSCRRGKALPNQKTKLHLFADSAGFCQHPACHRTLFIDVGDSTAHIAEIAHIFAANDTGPRARSSLSQEERRNYQNLILLCPTCHTIVDKRPNEHPADLMKKWKHDHVTRIAEIFGAVKYASRRAVREAIEPALSENRIIFDEYGPDNEYRANPESELAQMWRLKVLSRILPNNRKLLAILDANRCHLAGSELRTLEQFRQHVNDMEARHLGTSATGTGRRFPVEMNAILEPNGYV